jgi:hypothetical protein
MSKSKRATHFVPTAVFRTAFAGVVPVCVAGIACGGAQTTQGNGSSSTASSGGGSTSSTSTFLGVAATCFGPACYGTSTSTLASGDAGPDGVACTSFTCLGVGVAAFADGGDADSAGDAHIPDGGDSG